MRKTDWYPPNVDPLRVGNYEMLNTSTGVIFPVFYSGSRWFHDRKGPAVPLVRVWPWRGLSGNPDAPSWPFNSKMQNVAKGGR
ncbi:hypothetical protein G3N95_29760 [Paraburkholderia sp. Tr-20389]|uniref:hypothetical protein n=1 Tax=Paraburkholderia sp. Tr-20389 TaxID=2703903 RepID=UPI0019819955|nr:hypothetical protein [Paraburkholderia sp. Tr-20389]MBN3757161.1 hypothetical protein [Paraburkholderia sp. Tr-20389]